MHFDAHTEDIGTRKTHPNGEFSLFADRSAGTGDTKRVGALFTPRNSPKTKSRFVRCAVPVRELGQKKSSRFCGNEK